MTTAAATEAAGNAGLFLSLSLAPLTFGKPMEANAERIPSPPSPHPLSLCRSQGRGLKCRKYALAGSVTAAAAAAVAAGNQHGATVAGQRERERLRRVEIVPYYYVRASSRASSPLAAAAGIFFSPCGRLTRAPRCPFRPAPPAVRHRGRRRRRRRRTGPEPLRSPPSRRSLSQRFLPG